MRVLFTRDSVCAGDDTVDHRETLQIPDRRDPTELILELCRLAPLPHVAGPATWCLTSRLPLAVIAQGNPNHQVMQSATFPSSNAFDIRGGVLHVHACYMAMIDPEIVHRVLWDLKFTTSD